MPLVVAWFCECVSIVRMSFCAAHFSVTAWAGTAATVTDAAANVAARNCLSCIWFLLRRNHMQLKQFLAATFAAASVTVAAVPAQAVTLKWAAQNDILTMDTHSQNHATTNGILQHVYEGLVRYDKVFGVEPSLATSWQYVSPTLVRFNLRKGVKFHDGTPFTADDVVFSYGRITQPQGTMQIYVNGIDEIKKIDDTTIELMLSGPNPVLLRNLIDFRIMSKAWCEKNRSTNVQDYKAKEENFASRNAMGTG